MNNIYNGVQLNQYNKICITGAKNNEKLRSVKNGKRYNVFWRIKKY